MKFADHSIAFNDVSSGYHADQILAIDHGEIVQQGRHETLINQKGLYADFVGSKRGGCRLEAEIIPIIAL